MHIPDKINIAEVVEFLENVDPESKVYVGCDSEKINVNGTWYADFCTVIVVHMNNKNGGKVFGAVVRERDYDQKKNRPAYRMMREVQLAADLYLSLEPHILNPIEVHLDINPNEIHGSSCVIHEAIGYIRGVCQVEPMVKPGAWCSSFAADQLKRIMNYKLENV